MSIGEEHKCHEHSCDCIKFREAWSAGSIYRPGEAVPYQGSSYVAIHWNQNDPPPSQNWALIAAKGADGPAGPAGAPGRAGTDGHSDLYAFTNSDRAADVNLGNSGSDVAVLAVPPGNYMIMGQIAIANADSDDQNFAFEVHVGGRVVSKIAGRAPGTGGGTFGSGDETWVYASICANGRTVSGETITLRGFGYSIHASLADVQFMALQVGAIHS